jgi:hypothetical protein
MSSEKPESTEPPNLRREQRFKPRDKRLSFCDAEGDEENAQAGSVIDLSTSGIRLLCRGQFEIGQSIAFELTTDRSHGVYEGMISRAEPWVDGQTVLGCKLAQPIPESVLEDLTSEGALNRRLDDRVHLNQKATVRWPLHQGEVDVEVQDYSTGGMKIVSSAPIPDDVRLRVRIDLEGDEQLVIDVKSVWQDSSDEGCVSGVTYTHQETHTEIDRALGGQAKRREFLGPSQTTASELKRSIITAIGTAVIAAIGVVAYMLSKT